MLTKDFKEFIESLNRSKVRYLVIGGYAVGIHGYPRYTKDLDIWVDTEKGNLVALIEAIKQFGFGSLELQAEDFSEPDIVVQLGYPPNRIDIITTPSGIDFEECYKRRIDIDIDNITISVIDLKGLKANKRATGRHQDLADIENLPPSKND